MSKLRQYTFYETGEEPKNVEAMSFRKAVKSFSNNTKNKRSNSGMGSKKRWSIYKETNSTIET